MPDHSNAVFSRRKAQRRRSVDFPLWKHSGSGQWCKKVKGKHFYFGKVADDPSGDLALEEWLRVRDDVLAGREPPSKEGTAALTVASLANAFLTHKQELFDAGELSQRTFGYYFGICATLVSGLGKHTPVSRLGPSDFQALRGLMAKRVGPVRLKNEMSVVESIFRFADKSELLEKRIRFGPSWTKPTAKTLRKNRHAAGPRMFSREELTRVLEHASTNMKAMVLLGCQAGFGNTDIALLPIKAADLESGWIDYPRPKTGIPRRIPLWPETVDAIRRVLAERHEPSDPADSGLLFIGRRGESYIGNYKGYRVTQEFDRATKKAGVEGRTFYDLRRTFQTIGEGARDLTAVQAIMGHAASGSDMSAIYRQRIEDERLQAVTEHVRNWLFPPKGKQG